MVLAILVIIPLPQPTPPVICAVPWAYGNGAPAVGLAMYLLLCCPYTMLHCCGRSGMLVEVEAQVEMSLC